MSRDFEGKVVLVTGGGYGIGRAACLAYSRDGAKVVVADVDVPSAEDTVNLIKERGGEALVVKTDVSRESEVKALIKKTVETYGRLDCAFNNVGIHKTFVSTIDFTQNDWNEMMDINLKKNARKRASSYSTAASARGLSTDGTSTTAAVNVDMEAVQNMEQNTDNVKEIQQFIQEGKLNTFSN